MIGHQNTLQRTLIWIGAVMTIATLLIRTYLTIEYRIIPLVPALVKMFSYFTILTNSLVAIYFIVLAIRRPSAWFSFFSRAGVATAITIYIAVVGIVYQVILRALWEPEGWFMITDEMLHSVIPAYVFVYWLCYVAPGTKLTWKSLLAWLIYPLAYLVYTLVRGHIVLEYPYPFLDVIELGFPSVLKNSLGVVVLILSLAFLFGLIARVRKQ